MFKSNIPGNLEKIAKHFQRKWRAEGKAEGLARGKAQGKAEALVCLLTERFGTVEPFLCERIHRARLPTLERWFKRAVAAPDLPSVFARTR